MVTDVVPSPPRFLPPIFIAHRVQQSHCSSIFHRVLLTHALAFSASQFVHKKRVYTSIHSGGFELSKLTYTRLEDTLIRHRGDQLWRACITIAPLVTARPTLVASNGLLAVSSFACTVFCVRATQPPPTRPLWATRARVRGGDSAGLRHYPHGYHRVVLE